MGRAGDGMGAAKPWERAPHPAPYPDTERLTGCLRVLLCFSPSARSQLLLGTEEWLCKAVRLTRDGGWMAPCWPAEMSRGTVAAPMVLLLGGASAGHPAGADRPAGANHPHAVAHTAACARHHWKIHPFLTP